LTAALGNSTVHVHAQHDDKTDKHRLRIERHHHGNMRATVVDADFVRGADYAALAGAAQTFKGLVGPAQRSGAAAARSRRKRSSPTSARRWTG